MSVLIVLIGLCGLSGSVTGLVNFGMTSMVCWFGASSLFLISVGSIWFEIQYRRDKRLERDNVR